MKVTFLLPLYQPRVSGGFRVAYEYANHLAARGHDVRVVLPSPGLRHHGTPRLRPGPIKETIRRIQHGGRVPWFSFHPGVRVLVQPVRTAADLPASDVFVATAWRTAPIVAAAGAPGVYLIQHFEEWDGPREQVEETWRLPLRKVVISRWLLELANELDPAGEVAYVPNGMDLDSFRVRVPIAEREPNTVGMLFHESSWKGTGFGIRALEEARAASPALRAILYGHAARPRDLPSWIEYRRRLAGQALYDYFNELAVFLHPSLAEGWPLPPAEAMASGAALVAADNPGVLDYARAGETALVVPRGDASALAGAVRSLVERPEERIALATAGAGAINAYTWDRAVTSFERELHEVLGSRARGG